MMGGIQTEPITTNNDWEVIARNKTKILQKYLPDYNPLFYPGSDKENIEECFKKLIKKYEEQNKKLREENDKLIDELECKNSTWETKEKEYQTELQEKDAVIEYLNNQLDKYKKLFGEIKKETDKAKEIKGIMVNEDKTIITINGVKLTIGDKFTTDNTTYILKEIYIGKTGKLSLRTDKNTIRLGNKYIIGRVKIVKE
jgi:predicted RNase H-like nuclease (RuvC/YqgF family)